MLKFLISALAFIAGALTGVAFHLVCSGSLFADTPLLLGTALVLGVGFATFISSVLLD